MITPFLYLRSRAKESLRSFARYYLLCLALSWLWLYNGGIFYPHDGSFLDHPGIRGDSFASFIAALLFALVWYFSCRLLFFVGGARWPKFGAAGYWWRR
jgi:hypothetical protein